MHFVRGTCCVPVAMQFVGIWVFSPGWWETSSVAGYSVGFEPTAFGILAGRYETYCRGVLNRETQGRGWKKCGFKSRWNPIFWFPMPAFSAFGFNSSAYTPVPGAFTPRVSLGRLIWETTSSIRVMIWIFNQYCAIPYVWCVHMRSIIYMNCG